MMMIVILIIPDTTLIQHVYASACACMFFLPCRRPLPTRRAQEAPALYPRARESSPTATLCDRISARLAGDYSTEINSIR
jgi:hypothetical protein